MPPASEFICVEESVTDEAAIEEVMRLEEKVAHLRSIVVRQRASLTAHKSLHDRLKKGVCEMAAENLRLIEENAALRRLLKV